ncbi:sigma-70 family RNA polymerase sigma factor [Microbispora rosea]|uniref:sigma-70 family RNA polymerase sigma factor n=2 Tax=Microbispora rosea TaxID=58117 RepID=UPI000AAA7104|nr:sigma-70 family RNA polymerase sigma factor [Microbispora rosea]
MTSLDAHRLVDAVWKMESARIVAGLVRMIGDVGLAEELAQDAVLAALERWPEAGVPDNPGAWLMAVAKRRAVDHLRREERRDRGQEQLAHDLATRPDDGERDVDDVVNALDGEVGDDVLRLMFVSCHPVLSTEARVALTLRLIGGLRTDEIARAFLVSESAVAQRIVRAKRALADAHVPFEVPSGPERAARLSSVLEVIYLVFNEGYSATAGDDLMRPSLCLEALRLGRVLAELTPDEAEVHGLVALMELQQSRSAARTGPSGEPVVLHEQNRGRWDPLLIRRGFAALLRARQAGGPLGKYVLQAAIAACHARAASPEETDWPQIAALYEALVRVLPTPVVQLNRAVALAMAYGPRAGLTLVDTLNGEPALKGYHLLPAVRGDLLARLGRHDEARTEFERAASLTRNSAERAVLLRRATTCTRTAEEAQKAEEAGTAEEARRTKDGQEAREGRETQKAQTARDTREALNEAGAAGTASAAVTLGRAMTLFLTRPGLSADTVRSYKQTLTRLCRHLGEDVPLRDVTSHRVAEVFAAAWGTAAGATWNRHRGALRSFAAWAAGHGWAAADLAAPLDRRPEPRGRTRPIDRARLESLWERPDLPLRERALWLLLYESAAPAEWALSLNVEDLDLPGMRGEVKARGHWLRWQSGTAALLPLLVGDRRRGPLFLADRRPGPGRMPAAADLCPHTGRGRLSYERAEYLFKRATAELDSEGGGYTLHRLRHSRLAHLGEDGWSAPMLMSLSGHASARTLHGFVRVPRPADTVA